MSEKEATERSLAVSLHRHAHRLAQGGGLRWQIAKIVHRLSKLLTASDIDPRAEIDDSVIIPHATGVVIGETAQIGPGTTIMPGVVIGTREVMHGKRHATIGADVVIGSGAKILGPINIGDGASIGANAVVLDDVPAGATVVGVPAKVVVRTSGN